MVRLAAVLLLAGTLQAATICPPTKIFVSVNKEIQQVRPRREHMPDIIATIDDIFKTDPRCACVLKVLYYPNGELSYQCRAKR